MSKREIEDKVAQTRIDSGDQRVDGLLVGLVVSVSDLGVPTVEYPGSPHGQPVEALSTVRLESAQTGRRVALAFEAGRIGAPIVIGLLHDPISELVAPAQELNVEREAELDGERVVLTADKEIVLSCGDASIVLKRDGRLLIRGTHVLSRSSGPNRIKGASVLIN